MPIYEFSCNGCGEEFETIAHSQAISASCPKCGSSDTKKLFSAFSFKSSGSGGETASSTSSCSGCTSKNCNNCS